MPVTLTWLSAVWTSFLVWGFICSWRMPKWCPDQTLTISTYAGSLSWSLSLPVAAWVAMVCSNTLGCVYCAAQGHTVIVIWPSGWPQLSATWWTL